MKTLSIEQMELIEGGGFWAGMSCAAAAATVTIATGGNFLAGIATNVTCNMIFNSQYAY